MTCVSPGTSDTDKHHLCCGLLSPWIHVPPRPYDFTIRAHAHTHAVYSLLHLRRPSHPESHTSLHAHLHIRAPRCLVHRDRRCLAAFAPQIISAAPPPLAFRASVIVCVYLMSVCIVNERVLSQPGPMFEDASP